MYFKNRNQLFKKNIKTGVHNHKDKKLKAKCCKKHYTDQHRLKVSNVSVSTHRKK